MEFYFEFKNADGDHQAEKYVSAPDVAAAEERAAALLIAKNKDHKAVVRVDVYRRSLFDPRKTKLRQIDL
ncbi:hypothetical protein OG216_47920 (plasmid) [Streptomycetaceae bacterium NBC_01309]